MEVTTMPGAQRITKAERQGNMGRKPRPESKSVRMHLDVAKMIETCAAAEGADVPEWISTLLRPILEERLPKAVEKLLPKKKKRDDV